MYRCHYNPLSLWTRYKYFARLTIHGNLFLEIIECSPSGHLSLSVYDGFFFTHKKIEKRWNLSDNIMHDVAFCASETSFNLTVSSVFLLWNKSLPFFNSYEFSCSYDYFECFCIKVDGEPSIHFEGNWTFFQNFNVWTFLDKSIL